MLIARSTSRVLSSYTEERRGEGKSLSFDKTTRGPFRNGLECISLSSSFGRHSAGATSSAVRASLAHSTLSRGRQRLRRLPQGHQGALRQRPRVALLRMWPGRRQPARTRQKPGDCATVEGTVEKIKAFRCAKWRDLATIVSISCQPCLDRPDERATGSGWTPAGERGKKSRANQGESALQFNGEQSRKLSNSQTFLPRYLPRQGLQLGILAFEGRGRGRLLLPGQRRRQARHGHQNIGSRYVCPQFG